MSEKFEDIFDDVTKIGTKIQTINYLSKGKYPIVDQGQSDVAGYTDNEEGLFTDVPVIIFGDHTRAIKFVDYPFFLGADGVKVLKCKIPNISVKFLYYALLNVYIPNTGYNRHFKWLKAAKINLFDINERNKIVTILDKVTNLIEKRKKQIEKLDELVRSRFIEMFGDINSECDLGDYILELRAGKSLAGVEDCKNKVLKTGAATLGFFDDNQVKNLPCDYVPNPLHKVETGDVIISRMNTPDLVGTCSYVWESPKNTYYPDRLWKTIVKPNVNPIFIWQLMQQSIIKKQIKEYSSGTSGSMWNISKPNLLRIKTVFVPFSLQNKFAEFVEKVEKTKSAIKKSLYSLETLKKSLMQKYFG